MADITLKAMPFDANEIIDPDTGATTYDRVAYSQDFADWMSTYFSNGILVKGGEILADQLQVVADSGLDCKVKAGALVINGRTGWLEEETKVTVNMGSAQPRIDRVVAELNLPNDRGIYIKVLEGVPAEAPEAPSITQTDDVWQIPLATIRIEAASAVIGEIVDTRDGYISNVLIAVQPPLRPTGDSADNIKVSDETAKLYNHTNTPADPYTMDKALKDLSVDAGLFLALAGNVNKEQLDALFGKNISRVRGLGKALAMYGAHMTLLGENPETAYPKLCECQTLNDIYGYNVKPLTCYFGRTSGNSTINITEEDIAKNSLICVVGKIYWGGVYINGNTFVSAQTSATTHESKAISLADCGITSAGEYIVESSCYKASTSYYYVFLLQPTTPNQEAIDEINSNYAISDIIDASLYAKLFKTNR